MPTLIIKYINPLTGKEEIMEREITEERADELSLAIRNLKEKKVQHTKVAVQDLTQPPKNPFTDNYSKRSE